MAFSIEPARFKGRKNKIAGTSQMNEAERSPFIFSLNPNAILVITLGKIRNIDKINTDRIKAIDKKPPTRFSISLVFV